MYDIKIIFILVLIGLFLNSCTKEEPLNYTSISQFYGPWEMTAEQNGDTPDTSDGFKEFVNFKANGIVEYLKVYNSNYYPDGMTDLKEFSWSLNRNNLFFDIMTYHVDYCSGQEIFISRNSQLYKLKKNSDTLWTYYTDPKKFEEYESVDQEGNILNYKSIEDFYGNWQMTRGNDSFGFPNTSDIEEYLQILEDGKLIYREIDLSIGEEKVIENYWHINKNTFNWGNINYEIDYCKRDQISLSRSATHLILTRIY